ncbi:MAG: 16S rRNA (guanine(966)-N(2))-methyltransferase RsmD [Pyrinomonadaceae bacterium]
MRIIAGEYRRRVIKNPSGRKTRPTSDRLRETLFNVLIPFISANTRFLDLCAGTGAIGIEAISRGCGFSTFVDKSRRSCVLIEENLDLLQISEKQAEIICLEAEKFISRQNLSAWDFVFFDPPYKTDYSITLSEIGADVGKLLRDDGKLIVEHHFKKLLPDIVGNLRRWRIIKQGETQLSFYEKEEFPKNL